MLDLNLKKKIGQMIMCGFLSPHFDDKAKRLVDELHIGNFVLFSRNIRDRKTLIGLCSELNYYARIKLGRRPLISIDEECGMVRRLNGITTSFPGCLAMSATNDASQAAQMGEMLGKELSDVGINMDFAPDVDVNVNPDNPVIGMRSYGDDPIKVADFGVSMANGLRKGGAIPVFKHFPGHGDTAVDSHFGIPKISHGMERLEEVELVPFKKAIESGSECIMVSHLLFEKIDPESPATLSGKVVNDFLKNKLGFNGVAVTDCMEMEAITKNFGIGEACVRAILAGIDIVLVSHTYEAQKAAVEAIYNAVESGRIDPAVINNAVERIEGLKNSLPKLDYKFVYKRSVHMDIAREIYRRSITLASGELREIDSKTSICLGVKAFQGTPAEDIPKADLDFAGAVSESLGCEGYAFDRNIKETEIEELIGLAASKELIILGLGDAHRFTGQRELYRRLCDAGKRIIAVSLRMPYDIKGLANPEAHLCTYEYTQMALDTVCRVLKGEFPPTGKLPVSI